MNHVKPLLLASLLAAGLGAPAHAHDTINAANVTLEWHTDTNELLQAEGDSVLTISMKVKDRLLTAKDCRCTMLLYPGEVNPRVRPTVLKVEQAEAEGTLQTVVTAPKVGPYRIVIDAKPVNVKDFSAFRAVIKVDAVDDVFNPPEKQ